MDTSFKYIEMCENSQEIQDMLKLDRDNHNFNFLYCFWYNKLSHEINCDKGGTLSEFNKGFDKVVWLPRQDQLQEMLNEKYNLTNLFATFVDWVKGYFAANNEKFKKPELIKFDSMEKLWLAFVMEEKYNKIWDKDKKEWILNND